MTETQWGPLGQMIHERTYKRGGESWDGTVARVVDGNLGLVSPEYSEAGEAAKLHDLISNFGALPAGRHLWSSGADSKLGLFNCWRAGWGKHDLSYHACYLFDQLMLGGGVGSNYSLDYLQDLPEFGAVHVHVTPHDDHDDHADLPDANLSIYCNVHRVEDSREGWVDALRTVFAVALDPEEQHIAFDVNKVRPSGSPIHGFGGTASGPGPLVTLLQSVAKILAAESKRGSLTPISAMEIDHAIASCVVAGNVRRSARMSIIHWQDPYLDEFLALKADGTGHWSTNISVEIDDRFFHHLSLGMVQAEDVLSKVARGMVANGEPGFYNSSLASEGERGDVRSTNPCGEIALEDGEPCVLGHVNMAHWGKDINGAREAARLMARFLLRATEGDVTSDVSRTIIDSNRRIGVGLFGVQEWAAAYGVKWSDIPDSPDLQLTLELMSYEVDKACEEYAEQMGMAVPIKNKTVAPTGTIAKMPGVSEGIHPIYAKHFVQRVRFADNDPAIPVGFATEKCIYSDNTTVVLIPTRNAILDKYESQVIQSVDELTVDQQLRVQAFFQEVWADNAVSFTVNVSDTTRIGEVMQSIRKFGPQLKGTTMFPDASREQAPYTRVTESEFSEWVSGNDYDECATGACPVR